MTMWILKQLAQIMARYAITLAVALVVGSVGHFLIFEVLSGSFLAKTMVLPLFVVMMPSVFLWHLVAQFLPIIRYTEKHVEIKSALITVVLVLMGVVVCLPYLTDATEIDVTLFVGTFTVAAGLCGYVMDWLKTKEWKLCRFIVT
jgi:hypothetical protein